MNTYNLASLSDFAAWNRCTDCCPTAQAGRIVNPTPNISDQNVFLIRGSGLRLEIKKIENKYFE